MSEHQVQFTEPILDPTGQAGSQPDATLAPRPGTLEGTRIGLLDNTKANAGVLLSVLGDLLSEAGIKASSPAELVRVRKAGFTNPVSESEIDEIRDRCDVVVTAIGD
ncbi:MAG: hypothetical protein J2P59_02125 [Acidimicrobiales bacterium]|nr:hypothetical protein [Acidimicrobiales bacterium]MBO0886693.1 hypothetical protein [Acidimicrobiales bacterium]